MSEFDLSSLIDAYLKRDVKPREVGVYHPSEIPYCLRQVYYRYTQPREWPAEKIRIFKAGDLGHRFVAEVLANSEEVRLAGNEREFSLIMEDFTISGRIDDLIWAESEKFASWLGSRLIPIEVKTISGRWTDMDQLTPKKQHVMQLMVYLKATRTPAGILWYLTRDDLRDRHFTVKYDEETFREAVNRVRKLHSCLLKGDPPEPEAKLDLTRFWECQYCLYQDLCGGDEKR